MKTFPTLLAAAFLFSFSACSRVHIANAWKAPGGDHGRLRKIMVTAASGNDSLNARIESRLVAHLHFLGYEAVSGSLAYRHTVIATGEEETMRTMVADSIDAVLTVALLNWKIEKKEMPEDLWCSPYNNYNRQFWCYETAIAKKTDASGYYDSRHAYMWEFNFYRASNQQLRYCVRTGKARLQKAKQNSDAFSDLVLSDMVWQEVVHKQNRN